MIGELKQILDYSQRMSIIGGVDTLMNRIVVRYALYKEAFGKTSYVHQKNYRKIF